MADKTTSQTQQKATKDPVEEGAARLEGFFTELEKMQDQQMAAAQDAIDESAKLFKESMKFAAHMQTELRSLAFANLKQATSLMSTRWV